MLHPDVELRWVSETIGYGIFATAPIPRGTITWVQDPLDIVLAPGWQTQCPAATAAAVEKYSYADADGSLVVCWDLAKYMNHACEPSTIGCGLECEFAAQDLASGDELTCDYGALNLDEPFPCACGSARCRGLIRPEDFAAWAEVWDALARATVPLAVTVPQPLWALLEEPAAVLAAAADPGAMPSIAVHQRPQTPFDMPPEPPTRVA